MHVTGNLQLAIFREGKTYVAFAPALDLVAQGRSVREARKHFEEVFNIYLEETMSKGTLEKDLIRCGWEREAGSIHPPLTTEFPLEKGKDIDLKVLAVLPLSRKGVTCPA